MVLDEREPSTLQPSVPSEFGLRSPSLPSAHRAATVRRAGQCTSGRLRASPSPSAPATSWGRNGSCVRRKIFKREEKREGDRGRARKEMRDAGGRGEAEPEARDDGEEEEEEEVVSREVVKAVDEIKTKRRGRVERRGVKGGDGVRERASLARDHHLMGK